MTQDYSTDYPPPVQLDNERPDGASDQATTDVAKDQAVQLGQGAAQAGQQVAGVTKEQVGQVAAEAGQQVKDLLGQAQTELSTQAGAQQQRVASGLRSLGDELRSMTDHGGEQGVATDLARQAASRSHDVAAWLDQREPGQLLSEVREFARNRPGMFLALAVGAGVAAARLGRGIADTQSDDGEASSASSITPAHTSAPTISEDPDVAPLGTPLYNPTTGTGEMLGLPGPLDYPASGASV
jgi:hypothetical protein